MNIKQQLRDKIIKTIPKLWPETKEQFFEVEINYPPEVKFGDYTSSLAMKLAPKLHKSPLDIAENIRQSLKPGVMFSKIEVVKPGFLNFYFNEKWLATQTESIILAKKNYGRGDAGQGQKVQVEFVSANPTGPITMGNGRGGFGGDVLANVLSLAGYKVQREYYVNDVGNQVKILAESVLRRYWQHQGIKMEYPDYCYQGEYIDQLARELYLPNYKLNKNQRLDDIKDKIKGRILQKMIGNSKKLLEKKLGIKYDKWFFEHTLYNSGLVDKILKAFKEKGLLYKSEGAIWLKTQQFGDEKDRVLVKANEEPVYFLSDIAYHWNKLVTRKFDKVIDIWGADHHGYVARMKAAMKVFSLDKKLDIIIAQMVRLMKSGQELKMSKRAGTFVTLEELVDEVGVDAARFFFLMYDFNTHMDFDLDLAKKKSEANPVFYVQYAHARICSIIRKTKGLHRANSDKRAILDKSERALIVLLSRWPELILEVAQSYQVHRLPQYAIDLATQFHNFYTRCRVINGQLVNERRLKLVQATQIVLQNVLSAMGVSAPEKM
jgi:arginyl-tRNA synthetase